MPMPHARGDPDHVAGADLLDRTTLALHPAGAGRDDQGLAQRMRVPCGAGSGLEGDDPATDARGFIPLKALVDRHGANEIIRRALGSRLRTLAQDFQYRAPTVGVGGLSWRAGA